MGSYLSTPITDKESEEDENLHFQYGISAMQGWRVSMEDAHTAILNFDGHSDRALFGVFDGHSGAAVAKFCAKYFPILLVNSAEYKAGDFEGAFNSIYLEMDEMLRLPEHAEELQRLGERKPVGGPDAGGEGSTFQFVAPPADYAGPGSGCTAVMALVDGNKLYVANAGDSRCVLCHGSETKAMTEDHKPENPAEKLRIRKAGGYVEDNRVNGNLAMSRAIGDLYLKRGDGPPTEQLVVATPDIRQEALDENSKFIILACDGIWDILTNEQAVQFVERLALEGKTPKEICEALCDRCLAPSTQGIGKGCDNMSAIVVFLQKTHAELASAASAQNSSAARATSANGIAPQPQIPGGFTPPKEGVGSSVGPDSSLKSHSLFGSGQQLSLPKRFAVRRPHVPSSSLRAQNAASVHSYSLSTMM